MPKLKSFWKNAQGASAIEYGLIVAGIALAIIATLALLGHSIRNVFAKSDYCLTEQGYNDSVSCG